MPISSKRDMTTVVWPVHFKSRPRVEAAKCCGVRMACMSSYF